MLAERWLHEVGLHGGSFSAAQIHEWSRVLLTFVRRRVCAIRGHELRFHFEPRRLSLRCVDCGWETSGWAIDRPRFSYTHTIDRRAALTGPHQRRRSARRVVARAPDRSPMTTPRPPVPMRQDDTNGSRRCLQRAACERH